MILVVKLHYYITHHLADAFIQSNLNSGELFCVCVCVYVCVHLCHSSHTNWQPQQKCIEIISDQLNYWTTEPEEQHVWNCPNKSSVWKGS